jgi:hypothetical protein
VQIWLDPAKSKSHGGFMMFDILAAAALLASASPDEADPIDAMKARTEAVQTDLNPRFRGMGPWTAAEFAGEERRRASRGNVFGNMFSGQGARAQWTVTAGGSFSETPVAAQCEGGQSQFQFGWVGFDRNELGFVCTFTRAGAAAEDRFELAVSRSRNPLRQLVSNERAAELHWQGRVLRLETARLSGVGLPTGRVPGYVIRNEDGLEIGGMDYQRAQPLLYLPPQDSPDREAVLIAALAVGFFMDPANQE